MARRRFYSKTTGSFNTANGVAALSNNTTGIQNAAFGSQALWGNTEGYNNTANGFWALLSNTTGHSNTANGISALASNTIGSFNIALGSGAGSAPSTGSYNIDIGNAGVAGDSGTIRIGTFDKSRAFIAGISGVTVPAGVAVIINSNGQLGTIVSSARFKDDIKPMDKASEAILALKPVTFCYKKELDPDGMPQFGLVAEEVEKVNPDLVARDAKGEIYTVRYDAVNAMLLNEFIKQHRTVEQQGRKAKEQEATIAQLQQDFQCKLAEQQKQIKALTSGLEKVNNRLEPNKLAPQAVVNDR